MLEFLIGKLIFMLRFYLIKKFFLIFFGPELIELLLYCSAFFFWHYCIRIDYNIHCEGDTAILTLCFNYNWRSLMLLIFVIIICIFLLF